MKAPTRRWRGLTWVGWLNYLILRWLFVRIAYEVPDVPIGRFVTAASKGEVATVEIDFAAQPPTTRWFLNRWIWPLPWSDCQYVGGWRARERDRARREAKVARTQARAVAKAIRAAL